MSNLRQFIMKIFNLSYNHILFYPTPISLNYIWSLTYLVTLFFGVQIFTGCILVFPDMWYEHGVMLKNIRLIHLNISYTACFILWIYIVYDYIYPYLKMLFWITLSYLVISYNVWVLFCVTVIKGLFFYILVIYVLQEISSLNSIKVCHSKYFLMFTITPYNGFGFKTFKIINSVEHKFSWNEAAWNLNQALRIAKQPLLKENLTSASHILNKLQRSDSFFATQGIGNKWVPGSTPSASGASYYLQVVGTSKDTNTLLVQLWNKRGAGRHFGFAYHTGDPSEGYVTASFTGSPLGEHQFKAVLSPVPLTENYSRTQYTIGHCLRNHGLSLDPIKQIEIAPKDLPALINSGVKALKVDANQLHQSISKGEQVDLGTCTFEITPEQFNSVLKNSKSVIQVVNDLPWW